VKVEARVSPFETREPVFIDLTVENDDDNDEEQRSVRGQLEPEESLSEHSDSPIENASNTEENSSDDNNDADDESLSPEEYVAKMLVDHWINFKGCEHHTAVIGDDITGMKEFIKDRNELLQTMPQFPGPDFAQPNRLPTEARLPDDPDSEVEDEWKKCSQDPLTHMEREEWRECHDKIGRMFTGGDDSEDEDGIKLDRYLKVGKGDVMFANSKRKREMARGEATLDIDSILALFTDLSVVNTVISISIISSPMKNLKNSVHIIHNGAPLHWIPHLHFGRFGHDPQFNLFIFLPALYNKDLKRRKNNLFNHVSEELRAEFMDQCFLPAIREVVTPNESQSWDFSYAVTQAKSQAIGLEGNKHKAQKDGSFTQQNTFDLDEEYIAAVWNICNYRLKRAMRGNGILKAFKGFQFFIDSKGYKHRTHASGFSELMTIYKEKVKVVLTELSVDRKQIQQCEDRPKQVLDRYRDRYSDREGNGGKVWWAYLDVA
jgi:hypothetical protein